MKMGDCAPPLYSHPSTLLSPARLCFCRLSYILPWAFILILAPPFFCAALPYLLFHPYLFAYLKLLAF